MKPWAWWALGALALLALLTGGVAVVTINSSKRELAAYIGQRFERAGYPASWGVALAWVESRLNPKATNNTGGDAARGGAWGLHQMTLTTARGLGFAGAGPDLFDPTTALDWSMALVAQRKPTTLEDLGAWWNAGRRSATDATLPASTRDTYIPALVAAAAKAEKGTLI